MPDFVGRRRVIILDRPAGASLRPDCSSDSHAESQRRRIETERRRDPSRPSVHPDPPPRPTRPARPVLGLVRMLGPGQLVPESRMPAHRLHDPHPGPASAASTARPVPSGLGIDDATTGRGNDVAASDGGAGLACARSCPWLWVGPASYGRCERSASRGRSRRLSVLRRRQSALELQDRGPRPFPGPLQADRQPLPRRRPLDDRRGCLVALPASSLGSSPEPLELPLAWLDPWPWPGRSNCPSPTCRRRTRCSTTETVSNVAARSSVVPERLRSCDTCCTEPLVACDSTAGATIPPWA